MALSRKKVAASCIAIVVLLLIFLFLRVKDLRNTIHRQAIEHSLKNAWQLTVEYKPDDGYFHPIATPVRNGETVNLHSCRALTQIDLSKQLIDLDYMELYRLDEPWDSEANLRVAKIMQQGVCNYYGPFGGSSETDSRPIANIIALDDKLGAMPQSEKEPVAITTQTSNQRILFFYHPDSEISSFEPRDASLAELVSLVNQHGMIHAIRLDGSLVALDDSWVNAIKGREER